jgi:hypothetical protein
MLSIQEEFEGWIVGAGSVVVVSCRGHCTVCSGQNDEWLGQEGMEDSAQDKNQHSSKTISERENQASNQGGHSLKFVGRGGRCCSLLEYTTQSALTTMAVGPYIDSKDMVRDIDHGTREHVKSSGELAGKRTSQELKLLFDDAVSRMTRQGKELLEHLTEANKEHTDMQHLLEEMQLGRK